MAYMIYRASINILRRLVRKTSISWDPLRLSEWLPQGVAIGEAGSCQMCAPGWSVQLVDFWEPRSRHQFLGQLYWFTIPETNIDPENKRFKKERVLKETFKVSMASWACWWKFSQPPCQDTRMIYIIYIYIFASMLRASIQYHAMILMVPRNQEDIQRSEQKATGHLSYIDLYTGLHYSLYGSWNPRGNALLGMGFIGEDKRHQWRQASQKATPRGGTAALTFKRPFKKISQKRTHKHHPSSFDFDLLDVFDLFDSFDLFDLFNGFLCLLDLLFFFFSF